MTESVVRIDDSGRVRIVTLHRPDVLNAFNDGLYDAVRDALLEAAERPDIAVVVVTGAGRAFSAGQDLGPDAAAIPDGRPHGFGPFMDAVDAFPKPLLAAVNGLGVGIGLTFLLHCDLVFIAEDARLRAPFVSLGLTAEASSTYLLPVRVGWQNAARLLYTNAWIDAREAVEIGLVTRVCAKESLLDDVLATAREIAAMPISSLFETKSLLLAANHDLVRASRMRENAAFGRLQGGPANREAVKAFREKRSPDFTNLAQS
jgi:enoyl-CoA hydratase/carnithine racemase